MNPAVWLQKAYDELVDLGPSAELDQADAWRAVALMARLKGSRNGPVPPPELVQRLPALLEVAGEPDVQMLLDRVADELETEEDAWGPLLDALLDVDDAVGLLHLAGHDTSALEVARRVAGLVSLTPGRVLPLGSFAEMRLATLRDDLALIRVWRAIEDAPGHVLADALPAVARKAWSVTPLAARLPWLEVAWRQVQRSTTEIAHATAAGITAILHAPGAMQPDFAASLGESQPPEVELTWGEVSRLDVPLKTTVTLRVPTVCQLWHSTPAGAVPLKDAGWELEPGESPVLITVTESTSAKTFDEAVAGGALATGVVLVQADDEGPDAP